MAESGEVVAEAAGQASARGSACSKEWRAAELPDRVARCGDDGERDYGGETVIGASAMVRESEGERQGASEVSTGSGRQRGAYPVSRRAKRQDAGAVASSRSPASALCLPGGDEAAGWHRPAQCWAAKWTAGRLGRFSVLFFLFQFSIFFCFVLI